MWFCVFASFQCFNIWDSLWTSCHLVPWSSICMTHIIVTADLWGALRGEEALLGELEVFPWQMRPCVWFFPWLLFSANQYLVFSNPSMMSLPLCLCVCSFPTGKCPSFPWLLLPGAWSVQSMPGGVTNVSICGPHGPTGAGRPSPEVTLDEPGFATAAVCRALPASPFLLAGDLL